MPQDELRQVMRLSRADSGMDNQTAIRLKKKLAEEFRDQLMVGAPTNKDEVGLRRLAAQIKAKKVVVKLFLRHPLHAKLYLLFRPDPVNPATGYLGSSNLTLSGLSRQGELNIDVLDHDACKKLAQWFDDRWNDRTQLRKAGLFLSARMPDCLMPALTMKMLIQRALHQTCSIMKIVQVKMRLRRRDL